MFTPNPNSLFLLQEIMSTAFTCCEYGFDCVCNMGVKAILDRLLACS